MYRKGFNRKAIIYIPLLGLVVPHNAMHQIEPSAWFTITYLKVPTQSCTKIWITPVNIFDRAGALGGSQDPPIAGGLFAPRRPPRTYSKLIVTRGIP
jgi:hypothetical protein